MDGAAQRAREEQLAQLQKQQAELQKQQQMLQQQQSMPGAAAARPPPQQQAPNSQMNNLPIRAYLDQTVVPILLDGKPNESCSRVIFWWYPRSFLSPLFVAL